MPCSRTSRASHAEGQTRPITSAVSVGEVLNPIRAPGAASITAFTRASSTRVCAGIESDAAANHHHVDSSRAECRAGRRACRLRAAARINQQPFEVVPHPPDALLISLDPARNAVRVEWLTLEELAVEVDRIGIQPDPEDSLAPPISPSSSFSASAWLWRRDIHLDIKILCVKLYSMKRGAAAPRFPRPTKGERDVG
jgi:hypothetical protein